MKNTCRLWVLLAGCALFAAPVFSQKLDNVWLMGYDYSGSGLRSALDFYWGYPDTTAYYTPFEIFETDASICDDDGNLLFYTNGVYVADRNHALMEGSEDFNYDGINAEFEVGELSMSQCALILPFPGHPGQYYLFHMSGRFFNNYNDLQAFKLAYSVVDMAQNGGAGAMVEKDQTLVQDTLLYGTLQAVRHGNGRDWWVVVGAYNDHRCYRLLLTPNGVENLENPTWDAFFPSGFQGQSTFSPNGKQFAIAYPDSNQVFLWSFDRCDGSMALQAAFSPPQLDENDRVQGCGFSPNSRYFYVSSYLHLFQYDTWATDIPASGLAVAEWDGTIDFIYPVSFGRQQLGPDDRIYISSYAPAQSMGVIAQPNQPGTACDVQQHALALTSLTYNTGNTLPNFPHFRTGTLPGSSCDSLTATSAVSPPAFSFQLNPNPVNGAFEVVFENARPGNIRLSVCSADGKAFFETTTTTHSPTRLDATNWPAGAYFLRAYDDNAGLTKKLMVLR